MTYTDPNDRHSPRPCPRCGEDFVPGARGRITENTTCSDRCRKALQRAREKREEQAPLDALWLALTIYGEPLDEEDPIPEIPAPRGRTVTLGESQLPGWTDARPRRPRDPDNLEKGPRSEDLVEASLPSYGGLRGLSEDWGRLDYTDDVLDEAFRARTAPGYVRPHPYVNGPNRERSDPFAEDAVTLEDFGTGSSQEGDARGTFDPRRIGSGVEEAETVEEVLRSPSWDVGSTTGDSGGPRPDASVWEVATHAPERYGMPVVGGDTDEVPDRIRGDLRGRLAFPDDEEE
jgi:hypothetical protein